MKIIEVQAAIKVANIIKDETNHPRMIQISYLDDTLPKDFRKKYCSIVYFFVSDGIIMKIGGSSGASGITGALGFYQSSQNDSSGPSRFIIHRLIREELDAGRNMEVWVLTTPPVLLPIGGLFGGIKSTIPVAEHKQFEKACLNDYFNVMQTYPIWDFQENGKKYPTVHDQAYAEYKTTLAIKKAASKPKSREIL